MGFNRQEFNQRIVDEEIQYAMIASKGGAKYNPTFAEKHSDWVKDAQNDNYIVLKKVVRDKVTKKQQDYIKRMERLHGRKD